MAPRGLMSDGPACRSCSSMLAAMALSCARVALPAAIPPAAAARPQGAPAEKVGGLPLSSLFLALSGLQSQHRRVGTASGEQEPAPGANAGAAGATRQRERSGRPSWIAPAARRLAAVVVRAGLEKVLAQHRDAAHRRRGRARTTCHLRTSAVGGVLSQLRRSASSARWSLAPSRGSSCASVQARSDRQTSRRRGCAGVGEHLATLLCELDAGAVRAALRSAWPQGLQDAPMWLWPPTRTRTRTACMHWIKWRMTSGG